jgi:hypothetical protein
MLINVVVNGYLMVNILTNSNRAILTPKEKHMMAVFMTVTGGLIFYPTFFYLVFNPPLSESITQTEIYSAVMVVIFALGTFIPTINWFRFWNSRV